MEEEDEFELRASRDRLSRYVVTDFRQSTTVPKTYAQLIQSLRRNKSGLASKSSAFG